MHTPFKKIINSLSLLAIKKERIPPRWYARNKEHPLFGNNKLTD
jgi:hypothetical protein